jgi:hypothetical protein
MENEQLSPKQILNKAADILEKYGWVQNRFGNERMGFCALGAFNKVAPTKIFANSAFQAKELLRGTVRTINDGNSNIVEWNDHSTRTKEEVIAAFRQAANQTQSET